MFSRQKPNRRTDCRVLKVQVVIGKDGNSHFNPFVTKLDQSIERGHYKGLYERYIADEDAAKIGGISL